MVKGKPKVAARWGVVKGKPKVAARWALLPKLFEASNCFPPCRCCCNPHAQL